MKKNACLAILTLTALLTAKAQPIQIKTFPLASVRLLQSPFKDAQQTDLEYILALEPDRLLAPFLREAGIQTKQKTYGNWEGTGLDGHIGGHYLSALSEMYAATGNGQINERLHYMLTALEQCQQKNGNGYMGGIPGGKAFWEDIAKGKIKASSFEVNGKWVPWYNIHKLYAGLVDAYTLTGNLQAKTMLVKLADWCMDLTKDLTDKQLQQMLRSEHGGMNEVFADVADITGDKKYLALARRFSHLAILAPLLNNTDSLNGLHANTQIPKVIGFMRIAELCNDKKWAGAADFFWNTVVQHRTISIGGNSVREHFNTATDFSSMLESREGPETCNSYNMLKLSRHLFLAHPAGKYMDYYERTTYNHILSSQHPNGGFVYFTPIRPQHYRVYSQPQQSFWCCVGSGMENHGKYGEIIYAHGANELYINLFIPSTLAWKEKGLTLTQNTKFPFENKTSLTLSLTKPSKFGVKIRYPTWVKDGKMKIWINKKETSFKTDSNAYITIARSWKTGDVISVLLPMETKAEQLPDKSAWVSFVHGPIVLAAVTDSANLQGLRADDSRMGHIAQGQVYPIENAPMLVSDNLDLAAFLQPVPNQSLTFTASDIIYQEKYKKLQLMPFFKIHDARYMLYWPYATKQQLPEIMKAIGERGAARIKLEAVTVDMVNAGEQQPELDHHFKGEKTETGLFRERHFRNGTGWFSYDLKNAKGEATSISFTYWGTDKNRDFDVLVNGVLVAAITIDGAEGEKRFVEKQLVLPAAVVKDRLLNIKFAAKNGLGITGIYEVRLLK